jgi:hypothetical protein
VECLSSLMAHPQQTSYALPADDAISFDDIQRHVASAIADKVIVGHSLWNDLSGKLLSSI